MNIQEFQTAVLTWFAHHGRKDLPWQQSPTPYRVWVSEIMLQQTQVTTVIPYFERFMARFPTLKDLATAAEDEVLYHWTGLGYYARARNLLKTAQIIMRDFAGHFPEDSNTLQTLPGIGKSTAGAILALGFQYHSSILDGNVKRVLARCYALAGVTSTTSVNHKLWELAEQLTPTQQCHHYTQAMMDIGATLCTRSNPRCLLCPLSTLCQAYQRQEQHLYPTRKPSKKLPVRKTQMLIIKHPERGFLLEKRPPTGIWGSLFSFPEVDHDQQDIVNYCLKRYGYQITVTQQRSTFRHTFSHFHWDITPVEADLVHTTNTCRDSDQIFWYNPAHADIAIGLAAPVKQLLETMELL